MYIAHIFVYSNSLVVN